MPKTIYRTLPVHLTTNEIADMGQRSALAAQRQSKLEERKKAVTKRYKEAIDETKLEIGHCSKCVLNGIEEREVECYIRPLYSEKKIEIVRSDTNVVVETRAMTESEMQMSMDVLADDFDDATKDNLLDFTADHDLQDDVAVTLKSGGQSVTMRRTGSAKPRSNITLPRGSVPVQ